MADAYSPVGVKNTSDVGTARLQANSVDVAASAQDIDLQLAQTKLQQQANNDAAKSVVDYTENLKKLNAEMAAKADIAKAKNDGFNNAVDPTLEKNRDIVINDLKEMQRLSEDSKDAGINIFKKISNAHQKMQLQSEAAESSRIYNQLTAYKNVETSKVNAELDGLKASYNQRKEVLVAEQGAAKALADSVYNNAMLAKQTSTYAAKTEMGVASNLYERNRQALQDQMAADQMNLDKRGMALREKEMALKSSQIDEAMNGIVIKHMRAVRGLDDTSANNSNLANWLAVQPDEVKRLEYEQATKWAQTLDHAHQTGVTIDPTMAAVSVATNGTVADFEHFAKQNGDITGLEAYAPTNDQINLRANEIGRQILAQKQPEDVQTSVGVVQKAPQLTATEVAYARETALKELRAIPVTQQLANNKQMAEDHVARRFADTPDSYISQNSVLATVGAMTSDPEIAAKISPNRLKLLRSTQLQNALRGHPDLFTGKGDGVLSIADRLISELSTVNMADPDSGKVIQPNKTEVIKLVSELLSTTATGSIGQVDPELGSLVDSIKLATNGDFRTSLKFSQETPRPFFASNAAADADKFAALKEVDISDPMSLMAALDSRKRKMEEARKAAQRKPQNLGLNPSGNIPDYLK